MLAHIVHSVIVNCWRKTCLTGLVICFAAMAADPAVPAPPDAFQVRYVSNLTAGDSVINISNAGTQSGFEPAGGMCVNVYAFEPSKSLVACCSCYVSPNSLRSLSVKTDLISNVLTPSMPTSAVVKLLASTPVKGTCNAASPTPASLAPGMRASASTLHPLPSGQFVAAETEFSNVVLSTTELSKITSYCAFIQAIGGGHGICGSCRTGGLGGTREEQN